MTREEIEEGRKLFDAHIELESETVTAYWDGWIAKHFDALLALAEEARWREVETEPPPFSTTLLGYDRFYEKVKTCSWGPNDRRLVFDDGDDDCDIVKWRPLGEAPLPETPEQP